MRRAIPLLLLACAACATPPPPGGVHEPTPPEAARRVELSGARIDVALEPAELALAEEEVLDWVARGARAVAAYYGRFPVPRARVEVRARDGRGVDDGVAGADGTATVRVNFGRRTTRQDLRDDWVLTHELLHLAFPSIGRSWLEEGLATYVEPIARARAKQLSPEKVWDELEDNMPRGQPQPGDGGFDDAPGWERTYWGGAMFCLLADVEIRRRTRNERGLDDALRAIADAGGTIEESWELGRVIAVGDAATGVPVLRELYEKFRARPVTVNLRALFAELGVERKAGAIALRDDAPLAAIRRAITEPRSPGGG